MPRGIFDGSGGQCARRLATSLSNTGRDATERTLTVRCYRTWPALRHSRCESVDTHLPPALAAAHTTAPCARRTHAAAMTSPKRHGARQQAIIARLSSYLSL